MTFTPEEGVIGACLLDPSIIRLAVEHVMPSDFITWQGQEIFQAIIDLHAQHLPVDVITVSARLASRGSRVPATALHQALANVPSASSVTFYAQQVRDASVRRGLKLVAHSLAQAAENEMTASGTALADAISGLKRVRDDAPDVDGLHMRRLSEVMADDDSYDWVIPRLFERGDRLILTAGEGVGKSMLMRQMAILTAAGIHPFWLSKIQPARVMVIDRENTEAQWRRKSRQLWQFGEKFGTSPFDLDLSCDLRPLDITRDSDLGKIHRKLDEFPADILFIGPLYKLVPRAIQTDDEAAPMLAALDSLRDRGCVLITEAHSGHDRASSLRPLGSSAFLRWPEFGRGLREDTVQMGRFTLDKWRGDRDERSFPQAFTKGGPVPWTAEGIAPGILNRFNDQGEQNGLTF